MRKLLIASISTLVCGLTAANAGSITHNERLQVAETATSGTEQPNPDVDPTTGFKSKGEGTIIKEIAPPGSATEMPAPEAEPTAFKSKDVDTSVKQTAPLGSEVEIPAPEAEPQAFKRKGQAADLKEPPE